MHRLSSIECHINDGCGSFFIGKMRRTCSVVMGALRVIAAAVLFVFSLSCWADSGVTHVSYAGPAYGNYNTLQVAGIACTAAAGNPSYCFYPTVVGVMGI